MAGHALCDRRMRSWDNLSIQNGLSYFQGPSDLGRDLRSEVLDRHAIIGGRVGVSK